MSISFHLDRQPNGRPDMVSVVLDSLVVVPIYFLSRGRSTVGISSLLVTISNIFRKPISPCLLNFILFPITQYSERFAIGGFVESGLRGCGDFNSFSRRQYLLNF